MSYRWQEDLSCPCNATGCIRYTGYRTLLSYQCEYGLYGECFSEVLANITVMKCWQMCDDVSVVVIQIPMSGGFKYGVN